MKRSLSANLNIGHHGAQEVKAIKGSSGGKKPKKETGSDLRSGRK